MKRQFSGLLHDIGFVSDPNPKTPSANYNSGQSDTDTDIDSDINFCWYNIDTDTGIEMLRLTDILFR